MAYSTEKCIETLKIFNFPVFGEDVQKDEIESNPSFFIFFDKGELSKAESPNVYNKAAYISFITVDDTEPPDEFKLIETMQKCGLIFDRTEIDNGKIANTETMANMTTFIMHRSFRMCFNG
ncbi:hypothetical protein [Carnobacterium divergens]|uniref:Uncharacterized protein n=1 Tax=Carnobacterium divergens TaxID=2748 RepID=A0AAW8R8U3_CARDV|nr:hypothetical protein [Carnobacterium divergens]MDT1957575.1 hypothetical protein [Carnobacterium divergens]MDT1973778.1 hypothetical protein [Carnobacterium divergens]MDT2011121.1 hypothetical protein [Carnobacterium divergens]